MRTMSGNALLAATRVTYQTKATAGRFLACFTPFSAILRSGQLDFLSLCGVECGKNCRCAPATLEQQQAAFLAAVPHVEDAADLLLVRSSCQ